MGQRFQLTKISLDEYQLLWRPLSFTLPDKFLSHVLNYKCDYTFSIDKPSCKVWIYLSQMNAPIYKYLST